MKKDCWVGNEENAKILLALSQTTNFRRFQTERGCRTQFQRGLQKGQTVLLTGRKHCGKRSNCLLQTISPFPTMFSKDVYCRHKKNKGLSGKSLTNLSYTFKDKFHHFSCIQFFLLQHFWNWKSKTILTFGKEITVSHSKILDLCKVKVFADDKFDMAHIMKVVFGQGRNHCGKRRKMLVTCISSFSTTVFLKVFLFKVFISWDNVVNN